jgi:hypothetical protein
LAANGKARLVEVGNGQLRSVLVVFSKVGDAAGHGGNMAYAHNGLCPDGGACEQGGNGKRNGRSAKLSFHG